MYVTFDNSVYVWKAWLYCEPMAAKLYYDWQELSYVNHKSETICQLFTHLEVP